MNTGAETPPRLVCFPPAGGYAAPYRAWGRAVPAGVEVSPMDLPEGHTDVDAVLAALEPEVAALADRPLVLFGHSFGALVAYELAHRLRARSLPLARLAVSASAAPHLAGPIPAGAVPPAGDDARVAAWYALADGYRHSTRPVLESPVSVFGALNDATVRRDELEAWREHTTGQFRLRMLPGSHDLLREGSTYVTRALEHDLMDDMP
ncbi:thioesterase II family protein [Streptomyces sp. NPDC048392]|uniref:thioesterase II family protein n=1 Tax=Streptomyces sp. NPDC048392 TaxID=3365543 RepID=UPI003717B3A3